MKPLEFGSFFDEEEARFAIFSTYEFDPVHFEKYLLVSKGLDRARRIIVMVDASRFQKLLTERKTAARSLNQRYLVLPIRKPGGVFHPKLALLLGEKHADVTQVKPEELAATLETVAKIAPFTGYEHDAERDRDLPPKKHFRVPRRL